MKYRYTFFTVDGGQMSIEGSQKLDLEAQWLTLSTKDSPDKWMLHLRNVSRIHMEELRP